MDLSFLTSISPIEGRYRDDINCLRNIFSEFGLIRHRVQIEICWLKQLSFCNEIKEVPLFSASMIRCLDDIIINFNLKDAYRVKCIEQVIRHDVKAVEYFLKEKIVKINDFRNIKEFVHFGCTSEDINNLSYAMMLATTRNNIFLPIWKKIINYIKRLAILYADVPLLSRTHGQPATPSTIGKEMANFAYRLARQFDQLKKIRILGKFNGAVGNYNAYKVVYPDVDWLRISSEFVRSLDGIDWNPYTTQIEPHDYIAELFNCISRFNTILIDFNRDMWGYISLNYFSQVILEDEIGSSTMPHKINPIHFENSEGNLGLANAIMIHFATKLPVSRWQRDLTDSTILRNLGVSISYSIIAYNSLLKGISKIKINKDSLFFDLNRNWAVLSEPIQIMMRRYGIDNAYEQLKQNTRNLDIDFKDIKKIIDKLPLPEVEKKKLYAITPFSYIGYASEMASDIDKYLKI